jgi:hypothetical protein
MSNIAIRVGNLSELRHCTADNAAAGSALGYAPAVGLAEGLGRLITDGAGDHPAADLMPARRELAQAGLLR